MSGRKPTRLQADLLRAVDRGEVSWLPGRQGAFTALRGHDKIVTPGAVRVLERGWITGPEGGPACSAALTDEGRAVLAAVSTFPYVARS